MGATTFREQPGRSASPRLCLAQGYPGEVCMDRPMTLKEIAKITAGAVVSLVIVGWLMVLAIAFLTVL
ncbi:hypothetical protein BE61_43270 [Bradyrhizobium elkanii USDA 61]|nr:hypothetical protein BE61_43270 [Bradyrhizobium elkanii USDA 61]